MGGNRTKCNTKCNMKSALFLFTLDRIEVSENFFCHFSFLIINDTSVYIFHHTVGGPSTALHNILIRYSNGMHDARRIMPKIVEAECIWKMREFKGPPEAVRDLGGCCFYDPPFNAGHFVYDGPGEFYFPVAGICFGCLDFPFIVSVEHHGLINRYNISVDILIRKCAYLSPAERAKSCQQDSNFHFGAGNMLKKCPDVFIRGDI